MNEKLKLEIAECLVRGIAIIVWHLLTPTKPPGDWKEKQIEWLSNAQSLAQLLKDKQK